MKNTFIRQATLKEKGLLNKLIFQYLKELYPKASTHDYPYLDLYWKEKPRIPYLIYANGDLAGFVLINKYFVHTEIISDKSAAEFYILPSFRFQGMGKAAIHQIWIKHPANTATNLRIITDQKFQ